MISTYRLRLRRRRAQGMTEYIIIVGLIAIVLIAAVRQFSTALDSTYSKATEELGKVQDEISAE